MSNFVRNEGCPRCGSRDNVAVYDDGHKWCFGCNYYLPPRTTLESLQKRLFRSGEENLDKGGIDSSLFSYRIPERALKWLAKYEISDAQRVEHSICWCEFRQTLVFPVIREGKGIVLTNERYFGTDPKHPKYLTFGNKAQEVVVLRNRTESRVVLVEDFVSAIKLHRYVTTIPLLGSKCPEKALDWLLRNAKVVGVWLDLDKAPEALREASKLSQAITARAILTSMDPKDYKYNQIKEILISHKVLDKT